LACSVARFSTRRHSSAGGTLFQLELEKAWACDDCTTRASAIRKRAHRGPQTQKTGLVLSHQMTLRLCRQLLWRRWLLLEAAAAVTAAASLPRGCDFRLACAERRAEVQSALGVEDLRCTFIPSILLGNETKEIETNIKRCLFGAEKSIFARSLFWARGAYLLQLFTTKPAQTTAVSI
jgi:hypothetical protein